MERQQELPYDDELFDAVVSQFGLMFFSSPETALRENVRNMVLSDVRGWFPFVQIHLDEPTIEAVVQEAEKVLEPFRTAEGAVEFRVPVHIITATTPTKGN